MLQDTRKREKEKEKEEELNNDMAESSEICWRAH
jgi:hypothetical protein